MNPIFVLARRTASRLVRLPLTAFLTAGFVATASLLLSFSLESKDGSFVSLPVLWATSVSPVLPVLASLLGMGVWSDERRTGRISLLLTTAVRERDLVLGKYLGILAFVTIAVLLQLVLTFAELFFMAPGLLEDVGVISFLPGLVILLVQASLWCAVSTAFSAFFVRSALSAVASLAAVAVLPRAVWHALLAWSESGRTAFGEMILDAHVFDFASGLFSTGALAAYAALTVCVLFIAVRRVAAYRYVGRGARTLRISGTLASLLMVVATGLVISLGVRTDIVLDVPLVGKSASFSKRTCDILSEPLGELRVTAFLSRKDPRFRPVRRLLASFKRVSSSLGGARMKLSYVDPDWDIGAATRIVRLGATRPGIMVEKGRRTAFRALDDGWGERSVATLLMRIAMPPQRRIYWTTGHGEGETSSYGTFGLSDIARELVSEGYVNEKIDLSASEKIPDDCAMIVIAGAKDEFSRVEQSRLDAYLRSGGRLLVMTSSSEHGGVANLLPTWGLRAAQVPLAGVRTMSGTDVIVSEFSDHPIVSRMKSSRVILERPIGFAPSAAVATGAGADRIAFTPLASVRDSAIAAVIERGVGAGEDLAIRPTRIVAVGDAGFVLNGALASRANANRDFFLNCVSYLAAAEIVGTGAADSGVLVTGLDRAEQRILVVCAGVAVPLALLVVLLIVSAVRRRHL